MAHLKIFEVPMKILMVAALLLGGLLMPGQAAANHTSDAILPDLAMLRATVTGQWSGAASGDVAGTTAADGSVKFSTGSMTSNTSSVSFTVVNVSAGASAYDPTANTDPDGDSDGTTITVSRPF
jgi:hypothetical protein